MTPISNYKTWLEAVCKEFDLTEGQVLPKGRSTNYTTCARHTFYWLCFKDRIDLYRLSEHLGKHRTTITTSMKKDLSNKDIENKIWTNVKTRKTTTGLHSSNQ